LKRVINWAKRLPKPFPKNKGEAMRVPVVDLEACSDCEACIELCPTVFRRNDLGRIEVVDLFNYPEQEVDDIIRNCPGDCIEWEED
jgi:ferredoxin